MLKFKFDRETKQDMLDDSSSFSTLAKEFGLAKHIDSLGSDDEEDAAIAETRFDENRLIIEVKGDDWDLVNSEECRQVVVEALTEQKADEIAVQSNGLEYLYNDATASLFTAAGRFRGLAKKRGDRLADAVAIDPLETANELSTRVGPIADIAHESGLISAASNIDDYESLISSSVGLTIGGYYVTHSIPGEARIRDTTELPTKSEARIYDRTNNIPLYELDLIDISLSDQERNHIINAYEAIAYGEVKSGQTASEAIDHVTDEEVDPVLTSVLRKHTDGYGVLEDFFSDSRISDVYATSPVTANPLRVVVNGEKMATNVRFSSTGAGALGSRIRRTSGRAFSRAAPTVDATADLNNGTGLRIAGVTEPVVDGTAYAFREKSDDKFTLPALVKNGTMSAEVAAFLSIAVERNAAILIAGTRGAGKTTLLGTLLYELLPETRTVVIEDTPELPVTPLQSVGRDVQALRTGTGDGPEISATEALRAALRLGDGALVVGEIRGEEARVLYEAMRVGANANAVMGTIHGDGAEDIYERVVSDLKVPPSSFSVTDLIVTMQAYKTPDGRKRRLSAIEGVISGEKDDEVRFEPLYMYDGDTASSTGRVERGESRFIDKITRPTEKYADLLAAVEERSEQIEALAKDGRLRPEEVASAYAQERRE